MSQITQETNQQQQPPTTNNHQQQAHYQQQHQHQHQHQQQQQQQQELPVPPGRVRELLEEKLGVEEIANFRPVEFRCMIQDILGSEIYTDQHSKFGDRTIYYCITIPGENEWVRSCPQGYKNEFMTNNGYLRAPPTSHTTHHYTNNNHFNGNNNKLNGTSHKHTHTQSYEVDQQQQPHNQNHNSNNSELSNSDTNSNSTNNRLSFKLVNWSYPIPSDGKNKSCLIKVYDMTLVANLRVNDIVHVTGLVEPVEFEDDAQLLTNKTTASSLNHDHHLDSENPIDQEDDNQNYDDTTDFEPANDFPHRLVPRVHVTQLNKLVHINPLVPQILTRDQIDVNELKIAKSRLSTILTQLLGGDNLAAEYLILSLISRIERKDLTTLGQLTIGFSGFKQEMNFLIEKLYEIITKITTHSHFIDMSIANLNNLRFTPKKDHDNNKMIAGTFQLPEGLYLLLNETALTEGQLNAQGTENFETLNRIIRWQRHNYDFKLHSVEIDTDLKVLVISEGKSMLSIPYDIRIAKTDPETIEKMREACEQLDQYLTEDLLNKFRYFITALKDVPDYSIPEEVQKCIQNDFIDWRDEDQKNHKVLFSANDLSSYMTLARYLTISKGETQLTLDIWRETCNMESSRQARLVSRTSSA